MATPIPRNEARFSLQEVAAACHGHIVGDAGQAVVGVAIDSRQVVRGGLFVAIVGDTHDGHAFIPQAVAAGAAAVLVRTGATCEDSIIRIEVADTARALGDLAQFHRQRWAGRVVAITGSAGKTTTKELTAAALSAVGLKVRATAGNLNNLIGVPMTLLTLTDDVDTAVVEIGTSEHGEIGRLAELVQPDVGVVTTVAVAHTQGLGTLEQVAEEKASLLMALPEQATAVYSRDCKVLQSWVGRLRSRRMGFGRCPKSELCIEDYEIRADARTHIQLRAAEDDSRHTLELMLLGEGGSAGRRRRTVGRGLLRDKLRHDAFCTHGS